MWEAQFLEGSQKFPSVGLPFSQIFWCAAAYIHTYTQSRYFRAYRANYTSVIRKCTFMEGVWICGITYAHTAELSHIWFSWSFNVSVRAGSTLEKATAWKPLAHELVKLFVYMQVSLPDCPLMRRNIRFWVAEGSPHLPGRLKCANTTFQVSANSYMKLNDCFHMERLALQQSGRLEES